MACAMCGNNETRGLSGCSVHGDERCLLPQKAIISAISNASLGESGSSDVAVVGGWSAAVRNVARARGHWPRSHVQPAYFRRWLVIGVLIGIVAGFGAIVSLFRYRPGVSSAPRWHRGLQPPHPASEGIPTIIPVARPWLLPFVTTLGGLLTGIIVFKWAPEAGGTRNRCGHRGVPREGWPHPCRIPFVKLIASAITIGSGGSAGTRRGQRRKSRQALVRGWPICSISTNMTAASPWRPALARASAPSSKRRSVARCFCRGTLYKRDFEADALFPSFVASVVGFSIYGAWAGWTPVFGAGGHFTFDTPPTC